MRSKRTDDAPLVVTTFQTELGWTAIASVDHVLAQVSFGYPTREAAAGALRLGRAVPRSRDEWPELVGRLTAYAAGEPEDFSDVAVDGSHLTALARRIIDRCRQIPFGQTLTYGQLAKLAGAPGAARAVGNVMAANRCPLVVPCHRVVHAGGQIGNYSAAGGRRTKLRLLEQEGASPAGQRRIPLGVL